MRISVPVVRTLMLMPVATVMLLGQGGGPGMRPGMIPPGAGVGLGPAMRGPGPGGGGQGGRGGGGGGGSRNGQSAPQAQVEYRPEDLCTVEGIVRNAATGEAVSKASVTVSAGGGGGGVGMGGGRQRQSYAASTSADGRFSIKGIEPGTYRISIRRNGFVSTEMGGRRTITPSGSLNLSKGEAVTNVEAKLMPHAVITGRVTDADGEPIVYAAVQVLRYRFNQQGQRELSELSSASTNDLGEYRLFGIPPGRYVVSVMARERIVPFAIDARGDRDAGADGPVTTYYPGTIEPSQATPVDLASGASVQGIDVRVQRMRTFSVAGQIQGLPPNRREGMIMLMPAPRESGSLLRPTAAVPWRPDGRFVLRGVPEGSYEAIVESFGQEGRYQGTADVRVADRNVDNVQITVQSGFDMAGSVRVEGKENATGLDNVVLTLQPRDRSTRFGGGGNGARVGADGHFLVRQMRSGNFEVLVNGLPANHYVKSIRAGQADALGADGARLVPGMQLAVVLGSGGASVEGAVVSDKGEAVTNASVVLLAKEGAAAPAHRRVRTTSLDQQGRFTFSGVAPGDYVLAALDETESGAYWDPEFVKANSKNFEAVTLKENGAESKTLKLTVTGQ